MVEDTLVSHSLPEPHAFSTVTTTPSACSDSHVQLPVMDALIQACSELATTSSASSDVIPLPSGDKYPASRKLHLRTISEENSSDVGRAAHEWWGAKVKGWEGGFTLECL